MSALTDLFTALATKIRSKTGGSDTYTPPQMVNAIDDVYDAGVAAGTTPTQTKTVTAGTSAVTVTPDTGYALSSVTVNPTPSQSKSATPTTSAQTITPDSGKLLSSVSVGAIPSLSGDATAADVKSGKTFYGSSYTKQTGTYVEPTINSITPSNTSPVSMSANSNYKPTAAGYAISSYTSISQSQLDAGVYFSSGMKKMASSGYAYSSQQRKTAMGTVTLPTSGNIAVTTGFEPSYICYFRNTTSYIFAGIYDKDSNSSKWLRIGSNGSVAYVDFGTAYDGGIVSIDSDGFTMRKYSSAVTLYYFAIE